MSMTDLPSFHDGHLDGFITTGKTVSLYLRTQAGLKFTLLLREPTVFRGNNFREGNILFDVTVRDTSGLVPSEIAELLELYRKFTLEFSTTNNGLAKVARIRCCSSSRHRATAASLGQCARVSS